MDFTGKKNLGSDEVAEILKALYEASDSPASWEFGIKKAFNSVIVERDILERLKEAAFKHHEENEKDWPNEFDI